MWQLGFAVASIVIKTGYELRKAGKLKMPQRKTQAFREGRILEADPSSLENKKIPSTLQDCTITVK